VRFLVPVVACALLVAACGNDQEPRATPPSATPTTTAPAPAPGPADPLSPKPAIESPAPPVGRPTCRATDLTVTDADLLTSATALEEVFVVRTSGPACQLHGWPAVHLLRADGSALVFRSKRAGKARTVTLTRATSLSFVLSTPRTGSCEDAATLVARLPGTSSDLRTETGMQVCAGSLAVGPVERRQDDEG
jgi:hypothetical protein